MDNLPYGHGETISNHMMHQMKHGESDTHQMRCMIPLFIYVRWQMLCGILCIQSLEGIQMPIRFFVLV